MTNHSVVFTSPSNQSKSSYSSSYAPVSRSPLPSTFNHHHASSSHASQSCPRISRERIDWKRPGCESFVKNLSKSFNQHNAFAKQFGPPQVNSTMMPTNQLRNYCDNEDIAALCGRRSSLSSTSSKRTG